MRVAPRIVVLLLTSLCVFVTACGGGGGHSTPLPPAPPPVLVGDGTFAPASPASVDIAYDPWTIVSGHFFDDTVLDLVVPTSQGGVSIRQGHADGSFTTPPVPELFGSIFFRQAQVGDFNHDGHDDLAVLSGQVGVFVWLCDGNGTFTPATGSPFATPASGFYMAAGFIDADAHLDFVVSSALIPVGKLTVLLGNGDGTFAPQPSIDIASNARGVALGDFNWDGDADVVVVSTTGIQYLVGDGTGGFGAPAVILPPLFTPSWVEAADIDGDGHADVVYADRALNRVQVALVKSAATFVIQPWTTTAAQPVSTRVADLDEDGVLDLVVSCATGKTVEVLRGDGDGTFTPWPSIPVAGGAWDTAIADFDDDGVLDIAVAVDLVGNVDEIAVFLGHAKP